MPEDGCPRNQPNHQWRMQARPVYLTAHHVSVYQRASEEVETSGGDRVHLAVSHPAEQAPGDWTLRIPA